MKNLIKSFLSDSDQERIRNAVREAEKKTSGEIVPVVVSASYQYPMAALVGAAAISLPVSVMLTYPVGGRLWIGDQNMWVFLGLFTVLFLFSHLAVKRLPFLKRIFISRREMDEEVEEAARISFFNEGLYRTRDETGVLIFISIFERKVWVLADRGIHAKVDQDQWDDIVRLIIDGIKTGRQADAICQAVGQAGELLSRHFPAKRDDTDELKNLIIKEE